MKKYPHWVNTTDRPPVIDPKLKGHPRSALHCECNGGKYVAYYTNDKWYFRPKANNDELCPVPKSWLKDWYWLDETEHVGELQNIEEFLSEVLECNDVPVRLRHAALGLRLELKKVLEGNERFKLPDDETILNIALIFNDGKLDKNELANMVSMAQFIIDRLHENGDVKMPSSKEGR